MLTMDAPRTVEIHVTPDGVAESWLLARLGLTSSQVYALHGDEIGSPRHYVYCRHGRHGHAPGYYYTADGIRALAAHFELPVEVHTDAPAPAAAAVEKTPPLYWWQKENDQP